MNLRRLIAAAAAVISVLILQAMVIAPVAAPLLVSLPAVLVATIGLEAGVSAGLSVGFSAGLLADLGSSHPAGVLAIVWLLLGVGCGLVATPRRRLLTRVTVVGVATGVATLLAGLVLALFSGPSIPIPNVLATAVPTLLIDVAIALLVVPATRAVVGTLRVRAPSAVRARATSVSVAPSRVAIDG